MQPLKRRKLKNQWEYDQLKEAMLQAGNSNGRGKRRRLLKRGLEEQAEWWGWPDCVLST
jgi:hypothetical protein